MNSSLILAGANCRLVVSPVGPTLVNALAGTNVTLAVSYSGASDPVVTWFKGTLPVGTWTINTNFPPDIANDSRSVLEIEKDGSLTFKDVPQHFTGSYTVELTKSGHGTVSVTFTLNIYGELRECGGYCVKYTAHLTAYVILVELFTLVI